MTNIVSIIIPTRNSERSLRTCLQSIKNQTYRGIEIIIVDNQSLDRTLEIAKTYKTKIFCHGTERSAQRNFGASKAKGDYLLFLDSDMSIPANFVNKCIKKIIENIDCLIIPEVSIGKGFWSQCLRLEKELYKNTDWIEAPRFIRKELFFKVRGYNTNLISGEDWNLMQKLKPYAKLGRIDLSIRHNEGEIGFFKIIKKKFYYSLYIGRYIEGTKEGWLTNKQINPFFRYYFFLKNIKLLFRDPLVGLGLIYLKTCEYIVGLGGISVSFLFLGKNE